MLRITGMDLNYENTCKKYLERFEQAIVIVLRQDFLELKKNGDSMIEFLNKVDNIVFKLQSADEMISENLKIAIVFKALPQDYNSFIAAIQFQQISHLQLKDRLIERSFGGA